MLRVALRHFSDGSAGISPTGTPATPPSMDAFGTDLFTGWPSFALPLEVPPGTRGVQPDLALTYFGGQIDINEHGYPASNLQASSIGWGWDLNPGAIYRNRPDDWGGVTGAASLKLGNRSSTLVMNRAETGAFGAPSGRYHTEPETFDRVDQLWQSLPTPGSNWWGYGDSSGGYMQSYRPGVRVSFTFTGTQISWWTRSAMNEGTVFALIDGQFITKYRDVSGNGGGQPASKKWTASGLPRGITRSCSR